MNKFLNRWARNFQFLVLLVLTGIFLSGAVQRAYANHQPDVDKILAGKVVIYIGTCHVDKKGELSVSKEPKQVDCVVGADPAKPDIHFVGFTDEQGYTKITTYNRVTKKKRVIWRKGSIGA